jgi:type IV secretory pathway protease TraF
MIGPFKTALARPLLRSVVRSFSRLSCVLVPIAVAAIGTMGAWVSFGLIFNYTHSAPFGIYREIADPSSTPHDPAPYVFFCPDVRTIELPCVPAQMGFRLSSSL